MATATATYKKKNQQQQHKKTEISTKKIIHNIKTIFYAMYIWILIYKSNKITQCGIVHNLYHIVKSTTTNSKFYFYNFMKIMSLSS